jgi:hypothetical protein
LETVEELLRKGRGERGGEGGLIPLKHGICMLGNAAVIHYCVQLICIDIRTDITVAVVWRRDQRRQQENVGTSTVRMRP